MFKWTTFREILLPSVRWWEKYLSKRSPLKHTCSWHDKFILNRQAKIFLRIWKYKRSFLLGSYSKNNYLAKTKEFVLCICRFGKSFCARVEKYRRRGVEERLVRIVHTMYRNTQSRVRVNGTFRDDFLVQIGLR